MMLRILDYLADFFSIGLNFVHKVADSYLEQLDRLSLYTIRKCQFTLTTINMVKTTSSTTKVIKRPIGGSPP